MTLAVSLITYDRAHAKTQEILLRLLRRPAVKVSLTVAPFVPRPQRTPLFDHRPDQFAGPALQTLASAFGLVLRPIHTWREFHQSVDFFLICAGTLIDEDFSTAVKAVNCHGGLIPQTRGLDAFKWAIALDRPLGNTLHVVDKNIDLGLVLHHQPTPIFMNDDISTLARRHYDAEIDLLANFDRYLDGGTVSQLPTEPPRKRMPRGVETEMIANFAGYKSRFVIDKSSPDH